jgi:DNA adenine methylase
MGDSHCSSNIIIEVSDYKEILLENAKEGDFIYLDPPYSPVSSTAYFKAILLMGFHIMTRKSLRKYTDS